MRQSLGPFLTVVSAVVLSLTVLEGVAAVVTCHLGGPGFTVVSGDYDGDNKTDPAVYETVSGNWYAALSGSGYLLGTVNLGAPGCTPVAGDFDHDGKADPAVYQEATGNWYALYSGDNYSLQWMNFGGSGYRPVPGNYFGSGKTEVAVYAPASGDWYVYRPDEAVTVANQGAYYEVRIDYNADTYANIGALYARKVIEAIPTFESLADTYLKELADDLYSQDTNITAEVIFGRARAIEPQIAASNLEELDGFASQLTGTTNVMGDGKLSRDELLALNLTPDIFTTDACSGLAVFGQRSATGQPIIGRNLDWYLGVDGGIGRFNAVIYSTVGQTRVCSIGYVGILGCLTGLNDAGVFAAVLNGMVGTAYSAAGKRSCLFDIRHVLESAQTLGAAAEFITSPTNSYAYHYLLYMADKYESRIVENDYEHRRGLRGHDSVLNPGVTWGIDNAIAVVNSFVLNGNTDNHTADEYNYGRWNNFRSQLAAKGERVAFDDVKDIMAYHSTGGEESGDIYCIYTAMSLVYSYADNRLAVFFHPASSEFVENPQFIEVPVGFMP